MSTPIHLATFEWRLLYSTSQQGSAPFSFSLEVAPTSGGIPFVVTEVAPGGGNHYFFTHGDYQLTVSAQGASYSITVQTPP
jgi:hypothetical protein